MLYTTLISADQLSELKRSVSPPFILDCGFELSDAGAGVRAWASGHIPGAAYVHLDDTLSGARNGRSGRHPLPQREKLAHYLAQLGLNAGQQVVAYDRTGGMYAARLWWLLRWLGHARVCVLDGGLDHWVAAGGALTTGTAPATGQGSFVSSASLAGTVDYTTLSSDALRKNFLVVDARAPDRYRGENETIDPVGGHLPGARNRFFRDNLQLDGTFKSPSALRTDFENILAGRSVSELVSQCGSGVTACHNLLALEVAGLPGASLYPGSWSEWCAQPGAAIETGEK